MSIELNWNLLRCVFLNYYTVSSLPSFPSHRSICQTTPYRAYGATTCLAVWAGWPGGHHDHPNSSWFNFLSIRFSQADFCKTLLSLRSSMSVKDIPYKLLKHYHIMPKHTATMVINNRLNMSAYANVTGGMSHVTAPQLYVQSCVSASSCDIIV